MANKIRKVKVENTTYDIEPANTATITSSDVTGALGYVPLPQLYGITYSELKTLKTNSQLIPGRFYRITDFVTTTAQARTQSAGHQFDIVVQAIANNELSEDASAVLHSGDTYFANSNLKAWVLKYNFDNDTTKYAWADSTNGKGVIYYMKDEYFNECGYDFKNIQFARYKVTACANCTDLVGRYIGVVGLNGSAILTSYMTINTSDYKWYYTFDLCQTDYSMNAIGTTVVTPTGNVTLNQIQCTKCLIAPHENDSSKFYLNNLSVLLEASRDCMLRITGFPMDSSLLGGSSAMEALTVQSSVIGSGKVAFDGYFGQEAKVVAIIDSLIYAAVSGGRAFCDSEIGTIWDCCLIANSTYCIVYSHINSLADSSIVCSTYVSYLSNIEYVLQCTFTCSHTCFYGSTVNVASQCTCSTKYFTYLSNCAYLYKLTASETTTSFLIGYSTCNYVYNCLFRQISYCKINMLRDCTLTSVKGCNFKFTRSFTCNQDLQGCNFDYNVSYMTLSSTTTSQTITNTNIHDISGTDDNNIKTVVIPEDYTNIHTVEIYSANQYSIHEIN